MLTIGTSGYSVSFFRLILFIYEIRELDYTVSEILSGSKSLDSSD